MRLCEWCRLRPLRARQRFCGRKCRQAAHRIRKATGLDPDRVSPGLPPGQLFAFADPPYLGMSSRCYGDQASFNGEVDHRQLIDNLEAGGFTGWALSCSEKSLRELLPMCPPGVRVCPWIKPLGAWPATQGIHGTWEAVIIRGGRIVTPGVRNWLYTSPARLGGNDLIGRKPIKFCGWLFDLLGMVPGDLLADLFPGTGAVGQTWAELSRVHLEPVGRGRRLFLPSLVDEGDPSPLEGRR